VPCVYRFRAFNHLPDEARYDVLRSLPQRPGLEAAARACLGTRAGHPDRGLTFATKWLNKPPVPALEARRATPPHQDAQYFATAGAELPRLCSVWIALDAVDEENGCLRYMPFSHRSGLLPHMPGGPVGFSQQLKIGPSVKDTPWLEVEEQPAVLEPGDAVLHEGCVVHRAGANMSADRQRRALGVVYRSVPRLR